MYQDFGEERLDENFQVDRRGVFKRATNVDESDPGDDVEVMQDILENLKRWRMGEDRHQER